MIREDRSWAQKLSNLLSGCVPEFRANMEARALSLLQVFVASGYHARGSSRQDMEHGQANNRYLDAARKSFCSP